MSEWKTIDSAPQKPFGERTSALVYSNKLGVVSATISNFGNGIYVSVNSYHGNAIENWAVTHWMPLPQPPE